MPRRTRAAYGRAAGFEVPRQHQELPHQKPEDHWRTSRRFLQSTQSSAATLALQMADAAQAKRMQEKLALQQKFNQQPTNYNPPTELDPVIYFEDGSDARHRQQHPDAC